MTATALHPTHLSRVLSRAGLYHLTANGLQALCELRAGGHDAATMSGLARKLEISTGAITGLADALETAGFVERQPSRTDRRAIFLFLTDTGRRALDDILEA